VFSEKHSLSWKSHGAIHRLVTARRDSCQHSKTMCAAGTDSRQEPWELGLCKSVNSGESLVASPFRNGNWIFTLIGRGKHPINMNKTLYWVYTYLLL